MGSHPTPSFWFPPLSLLFHEQQDPIVFCGWYSERCASPECCNHAISHPRGSRLAWRPIPAQQHQICSPCWPAQVLPIPHVCPIPMSFGLAGDSSCHYSLHNFGPYWPLAPLIEVALLLSISLLTLCTDKLECWWTFQDFSATHPSAGGTSDERQAAARFYPILRYSMQSLTNLTEYLGC